MGEPLIYTFIKLGKETVAGGIKLQTKIIAVLNDLFFASKIKEAAKPLEVNIEIIKSAKTLNEKIEGQKPSLIILDLNSKPDNPLETVRELKEKDEHKGIPVLGYLSHVQTELKEEALKAGCDLVLPRSKFSKDLRDILKKYSKDENAA